MRYLLTVLLLSHLACGTQDDAPQDVRPNILFIMGDDHTTQAISAYGGMLAPYAATHNIDQLAAEGIRFDNVFCTNAICSPSRATILTGKYSHKNGVRILNQRFDSTQYTVQQALQEAGYETALYGKWHLKSTPQYFDDYQVLVKQGRYQNPQFKVKGKDTLHTDSGWATDVITQKGMDFLAQRNNDQPFFMMLHYKSTHDPWASRPPFDTLWQDEDLPEPPNLYDDYQQRSQAAHRTTLKLEQINQGTFPHHRLDTDDWREQRGHIYQQYIKSFLRCGRVLDENVGKIIAFLKEQGLYDNTIIIYTADQGHFLGEHGFFSKRFMYDEALRMPLIIRYPPWIRAGSSNDDMIINADFMPSILDMAGLKAPSDVQGMSFLPLLSGNAPKDWRSSMYYHYWQHILHRDVAAHLGIRSREHKLIFYYGLNLGQTDKAPTAPEWELFDLAKDPHEMRNVFGKEDYLHIQSDLQQDLRRWMQIYEDEGKEYPDLQEIIREHWN